MSESDKAAALSLPKRLAKKQGMTLKEAVKHKRVVIYPLINYQHKIEYSENITSDSNFKYVAELILH